MHNINAVKDNVFFKLKYAGVYTTEYVISKYDKPNGLYNN